MGKSCINPKVLSADAARSLSGMNSDDDLLFEGLWDKIRYEAEAGNREANYHTSGEHLTDKQLDQVRELGYDISWNSPCLWYEISW